MVLLCFSELGQGLSTAAVRLYERTSAKLKGTKEEFARALSLLRLALLASNPRLIVIGDITRPEAVGLAQAFGQLVPFRNIPERYLPQHR